MRRRSRKSFSNLERLEYQCELFVFDLVSDGEALSFFEHGSDIVRVHLKWATLFMKIFTYIST